MHENCRNGCVKPLNTTVFEASEADKAFRYMTTGKHIGKIVLRNQRRRERLKIRVKTIAPAKQMITAVKTYFDRKQSLYNYWRFGRFWNRTGSLDDIYGSKEVCADLEIWIEN